jgi:hypothetical protein
MRLDDGTRWCESVEIRGDFYKLMNDRDREKKATAARTKIFIAEKDKRLYFAGREFSDQKHLNSLES